MEYKDSMRAVATQIAYENERDEMIRKGVYQTVAIDPFATISYFREVCKRIGNLKNKEIVALIAQLKEKDSNAAIDIRNGKVMAYRFSRDVMYEVLLTNPICRKVCEKNRYDCWDDFICRIDTPSSYPFWKD